MKTTMSFKDFVEYAKRKKLAHLHFPNGVKSDQPRFFIPSFIEMFNIELSTLYLFVKQMMNICKVRDEEAIALIAIGSAVLFPGTKEVHTMRREYRVWGQWQSFHKTILIQPNDADFLFITERNLKYKGVWMKKNGIHLINRGAEQFIDC